MAQLSHFIIFSFYPFVTYKTLEREGPFLVKLRQKAESALVGRRIEA